MKKKALLLGAITLICVLLLVACSKMQEESLSSISRFELLSGTITPLGNTTSSQSASDTGILLGDVNGDGMITNADILMLYKYIYNSELYPIPTVSELHTYNDWTVIEPTTCYADGTISRTCTQCSKTEVSTVKGGHVYKDTIIPPTATEQGYTKHECLRCSDSFNDSFVPELGIGDRFEYKINEDGVTCTIIGMGEVTKTDIKIPSQIDGYKVTAIGNKAFKDCSTLTSVVISEGVTTIENIAFDGCTSLKSITIPNSLTEISGSVFFRCSNLKSVYITDLESWLKINFTTEQANPLYYGAYLYINDTLLTDIIVPDSITEILSHTFYGCTSITSITIHESVTAIGSKVFYNCTSLTDVYYQGTQSQWSQIKKGFSNNSLTSATIHYSYVAS